ncbi:MAG: hypothetical protein LBR92_01400 [Puniceicoccales bacterium]|jgi:hypothetical protein|nr:hypothetical protein [Puniceicoccales bacterium]
MNGPSKVYSNGKKSPNKIWQYGGELLRVHTFSNLKNQAELIQAAICYGQIPENDQTIFINIFSTSDDFKDLSDEPLKTLLTVTQHAENWQ